MAQTLFLLNPVKCGGPNVLNLGDPTVCPTPPAPAPTRIPPTSGGDPWWDRDRDPSNFLDEVHRMGNRRTELDPPADDDVTPGAEPPAPRDALVYATHLAVEVRATVLNVQVVERGNIIFFYATFPDEPGEVHFSYVRPGEERPRVCSFGQPDAKIRRVVGTTFSYELDTTSFDGGELEWHFWSTGRGQASAFGSDEEENRVFVPHRKPQLL